MNHKHCKESNQCDGKMRNYFKMAAIDILSFKLSNNK